MLAVTLVCGTVGAEGVAPEKSLSNITQLTSQEMGLFNAGEAYFSPDMKTIIFQATPMGASDYQIYTMDLASRKIKRVSTGKGACTCGFFRPDGKKIIFASSHLRPADDPAKEKGDSQGYQWFFDEHMDIFEADLDGSNLRRLTSTHGYDAEGAYSPDGRRIVFTSKRDGDFEIYVMNADGSRPRRITHGKGYDGGPFFSPDGLSILYRGDRRNDGKMNLQLRIVGADGTSDRAITDNPIFNWCPYWHPSGKSFIFTQVDHEAWSRGKRPNYDLFMMTVAGKHQTRITSASAFDGLPVFSPDGKKLMWTSKRGGLDESQVFIADFALPEAFR
ncbi:MAG: PD40 domain-containing protein [Planctomycetes bacterium]|nr:PD40 domain-containing protein [Planctomycetota bacterium]